MLKFNPQTGQMEDDGQAAPDITGAPSPLPISVLPPPAPIQVIPPGEELPPAPIPAPAASPTPIAEPPPAVKSESKTTTTREVPTKAEGGLMKDVAGGFQQQAALARQESNVNQKIAGAESTGATAAAAASADREAETARVQAEKNAAVQQAQQQLAADKVKYDEEVTRLAKVDRSGYYEGDPGRGRAIGNAIAVALGEIGRIFLKGRGGPNPALASIEDMENAYDKAQRLKIEGQKDMVSAAEKRVGASTAAVGEARQSKLDALSDLSLRSAARMQAIADSVRAEAARYGTEHAQIEGERLATALEQKGKDYLLDYQKGIRQKVATESQTSSGPGNDGTGGRAAGAQMQKATLAAQMKDDFAVVDSLPPLSEDSKRRIQENATKIKLAEEASAHGGISGTMGVLAGRNVGLVPKSLYEGLPPDQARVANAMHLLAQKAAALISTSHSQDEVTHARSMFDPTAPDAAGTPQQQMDMMRKIMLENAALGGKYTGMAEAAGATTPHVPGGPAAGGAAAPNDMDRQAVEWAKAHASDPRAKQILQLHGM